MCDQLIVTEDGDYNPDLERIADIYLLHRRLGHGKNVQLGMEAVSGDYVGVIDSDIVLTKGTLRDLCIPGKAAYGTWKEFPHYKELMGWCFVVERILIYRHPVAFSEWEGLGPWITQLFPYTEYVDIFEYSHIQKRSYGELGRLGGRSIGEIQAKEIVLDRHLRRLDEDPIYREKWG